MNQQVLLQIFNSMAPVFLLIFVGWTAVHKNIVDKNAKKTCSTLVSNFVFPALLFNETYKENPATLFDASWILAFMLAMCSMWGIAYLVNKFVLKKDMRQCAMQAMLSSFPNMAGMGIPFLTLLIGTSSALSVAIANVIVAITIIPATLFLLELGQSVITAHSRETRLLNIIGHAGINALKKPMVAAIVLGLLCSCSGVYLWIPKFAISSLDIAAKATNFVSLFAVGVALHGTRLSMSTSLSLNLALKCLLNPIIVWCAVALFGLTGRHAEEMIFLLAMPTATTATILAYQLNVQEKEASSIYLASTLLSIITLPLLLALMKATIPGV